MGKIVNISNILEKRVYKSNSTIADSEIFGRSIHKYFPMIPQSACEHSALRCLISRAQKQVRRNRWFDQDGAYAIIGLPQWVEEIDEPRSELEGGQFIPIGAMLRLGERWEKPLPLALYYQFTHDHVFDWDESASLYHTSTNELKRFVDLRSMIGRKEWQIVARHIGRDDANTEEIRDKPHRYPGEAVKGIANWCLSSEAIRCDELAVSGLVGVLLATGIDKDAKEIFKSIRKFPATPDVDEKPWATELYEIYLEKEFEPVMEESEFLAQIEKFVGRNHFIFGNADDDQYLDQGTTDELLYVALGILGSSEYEEILEKHLAEFEEYEKIVLGLTEDDY